MTWFVFALPFEAHGFKLSKPSDVSARIKILGACGGRAVARFKECLGRAQEKPKKVILAGLAGGLHPGLKVGDIVLSGKNVHRTIENLPNFDFKILPGRVHTALRLICSASEKNSLRNKTSADCVDMESSCIEEICEHEEIDFISVRCISDGAADDLPVPGEVLIHPQALKPSIARLLGYLAINPSKFFEFVSMVRSASLARNHLHRVLLHLQN